MTSLVNKSTHSFAPSTNDSSENRLTQQQLESDSRFFHASGSMKTDPVEFAIKCLSFNETQKAPFLPKLPPKLLRGTHTAAKYDSTHLINDFYVGADYDKKVTGLDFLSLCYRFLFHFELKFKGF